MGCNCKMTESIIAAVILVVTIWPDLLGATVSWWLVVIGAALLLIHAFKCKGVCGTDMKTSGKKKKK
jgi:Flp pilus assembly protein protease CpaA